MTLLYLNTKRVMQTMMIVRIKRLVQESIRKPEDFGEKDFQMKIMNFFRSNMMIGLLDMSAIRKLKKRFLNRYALLSLNF